MDQRGSVAETATLAKPAQSEAREARFGAFVHSHRDRAVRLAWRLVGGDDAAAEDVAQDAFLRAYRALARFRAESTLETWFYRILVRQAHNYRRWRAVRELWSRGTSDDARDPSPHGPGDPVMRRRISEALDGLTRSQREAFVLVHMEGFTVREASGLMRRSEGTVKSHLHRALTGLRRKLGDLRTPDGGEE
jgi:RNA polymerase sigma-70 factor (ECF subfamily)